MLMKKNLTDIYKILSSDETLLRLLYYLPTNSLDDPLSTDKTNVLDMSNKWDIIEDRIIFTPTYTGLDTEPKCRIAFFPGRRNPQSRNYKISDQQIKFDIFCHKDFNDKDMRLSWISDRIYDLVNDKQITGIYKLTFYNGDNISAPDDYIGYRLVYNIGSVN